MLVICVRELNRLTRWVVSETLQTNKCWSKPCRRGRGEEEERGGGGRGEERRREEWRRRGVEGKGGERRKRS